MPVTRINALGAASSLLCNIIGRFRHGIVGRRSGRFTGLSRPSRQVVGGDRAAMLKCCRILLQHDGRRTAAPDLPMPGLILEMTDPGLPPDRRAMLSKSDL